MCYHSKPSWSLQDALYKKYNFALCNQIKMDWKWSWYVIDVRVIKFSPCPSVCPHIWFPLNNLSSLKQIIWKVYTKSGTIKVWSLTYHCFRIRIINFLFCILGRQGDIIDTYFNLETHLKIFLGGGAMPLKWVTFYD